MNIPNFQARFVFTNPDGTLTMEALRFLRMWFERLGGPNALSITELTEIVDKNPRVVLFEDDSQEQGFVPGPPGPQGATGEPGRVMMMETGADVEFVPGPPGPKGDRGEPGPAIFMLEDPVENDVFWMV